MTGVLLAYAAQHFGALFAIHNIGEPVYFTLIFHLLVLVACHVYCFGWVCSLHL